MKTIGLMGGVSWEASTHYCCIINRAVPARVGGVHSARVDATELPAPAAVDAALGMPAGEAAS